MRWKLGSVELEKVAVYPFDADDKCECGSECDSPGKHPILSHIFKTKQEHDDWVSSGGGVAVKLADVLVVDVDPKAGGTKTFRQLEQVFGKLPSSTPCVLTGEFNGERGKHFYFKQPKGFDRTKIAWAPGIDIKVSGVMIAPPSRHISRVRYEWAGEAAALTELPATWLKVLTNPAVAKPTERPTKQALPDIENRIGGAEDKLSKLPASVAGAGGHDKAMAAAVWIVRGFCIEDESEAVRIFEKCFNPRCVDAQGNPDPWTPKDIRHKIVDAGKTERVPWGFGLRKLVADDLGLRAGPKGNLSNDAENMRLLFQRHEDLQFIKYNERADIVMCRWPWRNETKIRPFEDADLFELQTWVIRRFGIRASRDDIQHAVIHAARDRSYDELRDFIDTLHWDGTKRLGSWLVDYQGAENTAYNRGVGQVWLKGAVARVLEPGIKFDLSLILEGEQGAGKTQTFEILGSGYHLETSLELDRRGEDEMCRRLYGSESWLIELSELVAFRKSTTEAIKSFLTRRFDKYRKPYARTVTVKARSFAFCGTTNDNEYLQDESGNRRFLPVKMDKLDRAAFIRDKDQLLAEAVIAFKADRTLTTPATLLAEVASQQDQRRMELPMEAIVREALASRMVTSVVELATYVYGDGGAVRAGTHFTRTAVTVAEAEGFRRLRLQVGGTRHRVLVRETIATKASSDLIKLWQAERTEVLEDGQPLTPRKEGYEI